MRLRASLFGRLTSPASPIIGDGCPFHPQTVIMLAGPPRFEQESTALEAGMLPLHQGPMELAIEFESTTC